MFCFIILFDLNGWSDPGVIVFFFVFFLVDRCIADLMCVGGWFFLCREAGRQGRTCRDERGGDGGRG